MTKRHGITILEVLVAVALCIAVVGLAIMLLARHRENAQQVQCRNNLRMIGKAFHEYHAASAANEGARILPPSRHRRSWSGWGAWGGDAGSWGVGSIG